MGKESISFPRTKTVFPCGLLIKKEIPYLVYLVWEKGVMGIISLTTTAPLGAKTKEKSKIPNFQKNTKKNGKKFATSKEEGSYSRKYFIKNNTGLRSKKL